MAVDNRELMLRLPVILRRYTHQGLVVGKSIFFNLQTFSSSVLIRRLRALIAEIWVVSSVGDISAAGVKCWIKLRTRHVYVPQTETDPLSQPNVSTRANMVITLRNDYTGEKRTAPVSNEEPHFKGTSTNRVSNLNMRGGTRETKSLADLNSSSTPVKEDCRVPEADIVCRA